MFYCNGGGGKTPKFIKKYLWFSLSWYSHDCVCYDII